MIARIAIVFAALAAALAPLPAQFIERWYSRAWYSHFQSFVTPATNLVPVALLDLAAGAAVVAVSIYAWRRRPLRLAPVLGSLVVAVAALYLIFLLTWGFNYRRVRMEAKLAFDSSRISRDAAVRLANDAVARVNAMHAAAHAIRFDARPLQMAFASVRGASGHPQTLGTRVVLPEGSHRRHDGSLLSGDHRQSRCPGNRAAVGVRARMGASGRLRT